MATGGENLKCWCINGFTDPEQEEKIKEFLDNVIYIKNDDKWYDKSTGKEYTQSTIQVHMVISLVAKDQMCLQSLLLVKVHN